RIDYSDGPVRIKDLQAWVCKQAGAEGWDKTYKESNGSNVAIVGAGPSGLSCAYYLAKVGYSVDVFEKESKAGGIPSQAIPKFRLSDDVFDREIGELLKNPNITMNYNKEIGKDLELTELTENYDAVYLATGLNAGRLLQTEGIDTVNAVDALSFLRSYNNGQLTSIEDNVLVIGGGSVATDAAMVASKLGAKTVSVVCLETEEDMPCLTSELQELRDKGIQVVNAYGPQTFGADPEQHIICVSCTSVFDKDDNFCPEFDESKTKKITFEKVIIAIGQQIESEFETYLQKAIGGVKVNDDSFLVTGQTKIYAGGDLIRGAGTIVQAVADGRQVAQKIHKTLSK
ncbi:MAG: FAD-dependent oxidoreductase, partial [Candidatus Heimdallarchaeota archaeon]